MPGIGKFRAGSDPLGGEDVNMILVNHVRRGAFKL